MKTRGLSLLCCNPFEEKYMKKLAAVLAVLLLSTLLFAASYDEILSKSMANSPQMKNAELTYQNSLLTQQQNDLSDVAQVTVSTGTISVLPNENSSTTVGDSIRALQIVLPDIYSRFNEQELSTIVSRSVSADFTMSPSVEVVLPNDGATKITASADLGFEYGDSSYYSVAPDLSISHKFDLTGYDSDLASSLSNARSSLQSEMTYRNAKLTFESQVLTSIKTILSAQQSLDEANYNLAKAEKNLSNALELGNISETSVSYMQTMNNINLQKRTIDATEKQIATAMEQYTTLTGLEWDGVENLPSPDLTLNILPNGNTEVILASIDVEIAQQAIAAKQHEVSPSSISVSGNVNSSLSEQSKTVGGSGAVSYQAGNWSVGAGFGGTYSNRTDKFTPSLTFAGNWSNKTTKRSDDLELQKLNNDLISAQNDLADARTSYVQSAQNLQISILNHNYTVQNHAAEKPYYESNLEYQKTLLDAGLCSQDDVNDASKQVEWAGVTEITDQIDGLLLQIQIEQLNL